MKLSAKYPVPFKNLIYIYRGKIRMRFLKGTGTIVIVDDATQDISTLYGST